MDLQKHLSMIFISSLFFSFFLSSCTFEIRNNDRDKKYYITSKTPFFKWSTQSVSSDGVPHLHVEFFDESKATIELFHYNPIQTPIKKNSESLSYMGSILGEKDSVVSLTGSSFGSLIYVTLLRRGKMGITVSVDRHGRSYHESPKQYLRNEFPKNDVLLESDYFMESLRSSLDNLRRMPPINYLRIIAAYTSSLFDYIGSEERIAEILTQILTHVQAYYLHPTLGFKVYLQIPAPLLDFRNKTSISKATTEELRSVQTWTIPTLRKNNGQHLAFFVHDVSGDDVGGLSIMKGMCSETNKSVSINEYNGNILEASKIMAHELAHSFGANHDYSPCRGIMHWRIDGDNTWSSCSRYHFRAHFNKILSSTGSWCLAQKFEDIGTWNEWGPFSPCSLSCEGGIKTRTRTCSNVICTGTVEESAVCNTQICDPCIDVSLDCESKNCEDDIDYTKVNCAKTCHVNDFHKCTMTEEVN